MAQSHKLRDVARIFQRGVTLCQSEGAHQIVTSFLPSVIGCLFEKGIQRGGGGEIGGVMGTPGLP